MALELSKTFEKVSGLDPEEGMVKAGLQPEGKRISYHVGTAEDLGAVGIEDNSVDLVIAGEAAHYFDHSVTWPELARVLRPSGTVCWAGYGRLTIAGNDAANAVIAQFMDETLAGHWSEPGWSISEGLYDRIPFPITPAYTQATEELIATLPDLTGDGHPIQAKIAEPTPTGGAGWDATSAIRLKSGTTAGQWYLRQSWTPRQLERIFRTWSSVKRYQDHQPTDRSAKLDVVGRVMAELTPLLGDQFAVVWPFVLMMIRRDALA